ncbi:unnamed protein product [Cunninghamella echinulata]
MDEDEKEMLSEARARLANTQGKKAKRKARERQLEEARRLTTLQKRRELKAAGINVRVKKLKNTMDYNTDIPFEKKAPLGFYDVTEEKDKKSNAELLTNVRLSQLNRRRADIEEEKEREKKRKQREGGGNNKKKSSSSAEGNQGKFVLAKNSKVIQMQEQEQIAKRRKLVLPAPQVGEDELEEIVKSGFAGESAKSLVQEDEEGNMTSGLLGDYSVTPNTMSTRTPRVAMQSDNLMNEARNLRALTATQTPLLGGDNVVLEGDSGTGFDGITPRNTVVQTPNPMATPLRGVTTPSVGNQTPFKTPLRDHFNINDPSGNSIAATPRDEKLAQMQRKRTLLQGLASLPKPRNEWEIRLPDLDDDNDGKDDNNKDKSTTKGTYNEVEDMSVIEKKLKEQSIKDEQERLGRRSLAVQFGLPRPISIPASIKQVNQHLDDIQNMIQQEFIRLLQYDAIKYPVAGSTIAPGSVSLDDDLIQLEDEFDTATLEDARKEMENELKDMLQLDNDDDSMEDKDEKENTKQLIWNHIQQQSDFEQFWDKEHNDLLFSAKFKQYLTMDEMSDDDDKIQGLEKIIEANRQAMIRDATKAGKLEKKLEVRLGGYMTRSKTLSQQILDAYEELEAAKVEYESFLNLQMTEKVAIPRRIQSLEDEVHKLAERERDLQEKYKRLSEEKSQIMESLS